MGIFQKPPGSGCYWISYFENGKQRREKVGKSEKTAERLLAKRKEAIRMARLFPEEHQAERSLTVGELIEKYLPLMERKRSYKDDVRLAGYCTEEWGRTLARDLKPSEIEAYRVRRLKTVRPATVNRAVAFLKRVYNLAIRDDLVTSNPVAKLKMLKENNVLREDWTPEEERAILAACSRPHQIMFLLALLTGLRGGEQFGLAWKQVDLAAGLVKLKDTKNGEPRDVPLSEQAQALLKEQHRSSGKTKWVFPGRDPSKPYRRDSAYTALQRACKRAGVPGKRLHSTRHAFCSQMIMAGVDLKTVSELAGHTTIAVTAQLYGHVNQQHKQAAVEKLAAARNEKNGAT